MKKLLLTAAGALMALPAMASFEVTDAEASKLKEETRQGVWSVVGCGQRGQGTDTDGGFAELFDGNTSTFWHSSWGNDKSAPHFFIVDRQAENADVPIDGFGYLPRQGNTNGNGFVTDYRVFVTDDISAISYCTADQHNQLAANAHTSLQAAIADLTPAAQGRFNCVYNTAATHGLKRVIFDEAVTGRYVIFVVDGSSNALDPGEKHANCAEFYLYQLNNGAYRVHHNFKRSATDANPYSYLTLNADSYTAPEGFARADNAEVTASNPNVNYVMNEGTEFRLYNERQNKYVRANDAENGLTQLAIENPGEQSLFKMIPMGNDGGFAIYYPKAGKFVGHIVDANHTTPLVDFNSNPAKYYTGKQNAPADYMSWVGHTTAKTGHNYFNDLSGSGICGFSWDDDGSKWVIVTNLAKFKENWALRQQLVAAIPNYEATLEFLGETDTEGLKEWAQAYNFGGDVNIDPSAADLEKINKILNATLRKDIAVDKRIGDALVAAGLASANAASAWKATKAAVGDEVSNDVRATLNEGINALLKSPDNVTVSMVTGKPDNTNLTHNLGMVYNASTNIVEVKRSEAASNNSSVWTLKSAGDNGFYLYNEYANAYLKHSVKTYASLTTTRNIEEASVYVLEIEDTSAGTSDAMQWIYGIKTIDEATPGNLVYIHSNQSEQVVGWGINGSPASTWILSHANADTAAAQHLNGAVDICAIPATNNTVGYMHTDESAINAKRAAAVAAQAEGTDAADRRAAADELWAAYNSLSYTLNMPIAGEIYTIESSDGRGYLTSQAGQLYMWTSGKTALEEGSTANQWAVVENNGEAYLYNLTAGKFANAYGFKQGAPANGVTYAWILSDVPTAVAFNGNVYAQPADGTSRPFTINGGEDTHADRPGMMIINGIDTPVPAIAGYGDAYDGSGFRFVKVGEATAEQLAAINALIAADDNAAAANADAEALVAKLPENHTDIVGHYSAEAVALFNERLASAEGAAADKIAGISEAAADALDGSVSVALQNGIAYTIADAEGNLIAGADINDFAEDAVPAEAYNWLCTVEGNVVYFTHTHNGTQSNFLNGQFTVARGSKAGRVVLNPYSAPEAEAMLAAEEAPAEYVITSKGENAGTETTEINEININDNVTEGSVYDLQGRRLAAPVKGINIINGKKVLVR